MFMTFQYRGLNLELYCILTIEEWLKLNTILIADIWNNECI